MSGVVLLLWGFCFFFVPSQQNFFHHVWTGISRSLNIDQFYLHELNWWSSWEIFILWHDVITSLYNLTDCLIKAAGVCVCVCVTVNTCRPAETSAHFFMSEQQQEATKTHKSPVLLCLSQPAVRPISKQNKSLEHLNKGNILNFNYFYSICFCCKQTELNSVRYQ